MTPLPARRCYPSPLRTGRLWIQVHPDSRKGFLNADPGDARLADPPCGVRLTLICTGSTINGKSGRRPLYVCLCNAIRCSDVRSAAGAGVSTPGGVYRHLGCRPQCGRCRNTIVDLLSASATTEPRSGEGSPSDGGSGGRLRR